MQAQATQYFLVVNKDRDFYAISFEEGCESDFLELLVAYAEDERSSLAPGDVMRILDEVEAFLATPGGPPVVKIPARV